MSEFQPKYLDAKNLDPYKRVKYSHGLVLGVDEFNQEETYLLEKQRLHNRALHGYGTLCGLKITVEEEEAAPGHWKLTVAPGHALDPQGRGIRVPEAQCADLIEWLNKEKHRADVFQELGIEASSPPFSVSPPAPLSLCLVLCYDQCDTDFVPVPSGPCQSLDKTSVASRTADDFSLRLEFEENCPQQLEEEKIQQLISLLKQIEISEAPGGLSLEDIPVLVHSLIADDSPGVFSPPVGNMHMSASEAELFINTAMRIWVTEVRSSLVASEKNCSAGPIDETCVLLARLDFAVENTAAGLRIVGDVTLDEEERPFLLQTRLLQEQILQCCAGASDALISSPPSGLVDETNIMHLTTDEIAEGRKTFSDPMGFSSNGRFRKRIMLPPTTGMLVNEKTVSSDFFRAGVPALKFNMNGEVAFNITVPDDIEYSIAPQVRLVWGIKGSDNVDIDFSWQIRNRFADPGKIFGAFSSNSIADTQTQTRPSVVHITDFINLADKVSPDDVFGALRVKLDSVNPNTVEIFLLHVEIRYTADRLGRPMT